MADMVEFLVITFETRSRDIIRSKGSFTASIGKGEVSGIWRSVRKRELFSYANNGSVFSIDRIGDMGKTSIRILIFLGGIRIIKRFP